MQKSVKLAKTIEVIQVPFGTPTTLAKDTEVTIMHILGGNFTIVADGSMYRVENHDADALHFSQQLANKTDTLGDSLEDKIWSALRTCYDPEIPVNVVDLGLIYGIEVQEDIEQRKTIVKVRMTLTSPGCGMGSIIISDVKNRLLSLPEVNSVEIATVFDPPWDRSMMSDQAKLDLGIL
jgi:probable FeS assembly SUF system protein SufT